ncbi:hypothetical protein K1719_002009 [Acacia pycnantha]|nr:hypothetical protein K1719_002009 [Acacia pycnantha]
MMRLVVQLVVGSSLNCNYGWMTGLGAAMPPNADALGLLLFEYSKCVYTSQLQHLKVQMKENMLGTSVQSRERI